MKYLGEISDRFDVTNKGYVDDKVEEAFTELPNAICNTPYNAESNKVATMADIENALLVDEEELV